MKILDNAVALFVIVIILLIIIPLNTVLLDMMILFNIALSLIVLLITMYTKETLEFSVFPSLLLLTTLFRVGLNVSSTRLILGNSGEAGQVIRTFGEFVIGGNVVVGLVIFLIIVVIQFIVITKGAERVAEVSARFTLDAMPGKQMAIDADLNAGLINEQTAKERRSKIQREADFYGAMDGASKFVKGDAIISIVIILINIIGGSVIGLIQGSSDLTSILTKYTIATVGDGLVSQLPALLISTATGMIVTRAASENSLGQELSNQLMGQPLVMIITGGSMLFLALIPGMPKLVLFLIGGIFIAIGVRLRKEVKQTAEEEVEEEIVSEMDFYKNIDNIYSLINVELIEMEFGYSIVPLIDETKGGSFVDRIVLLRKQYAAEMGIVIPAIRLRDNVQLNPGEYLIKIKGEEVARGEVLADHYLAMESESVSERIEGIDTYDPTFGLPAKWINEDRKDEAEIYGYTVIDPLSVIITHLSHVIKRHIHELLSRQEINSLLENVKKTSKSLVEEVIPAVISLGDFQKILCNLLKEGITIRDLSTILETIGEFGNLTKDTDMLTEYVRQSLKRTITRKYCSGNKINVIALDPELEKTIMSSLRKTEHSSYIAMEPAVIETLIKRIIEETNKLREITDEVIIMCSPVVRFYFKKMTEQFLPEITVLSFSEIESNVQIVAVGTVSL